MVEKQTYTYKRIGDLPLMADVYRAPGDGAKPAIIWIHGGCLMYGDRSGLPREQSDLYTKAGYTVVAIDYRLAPAVKIAAIIEDLKDAINWVHDQGPARFGVDPRCIAVIGHSAGGYLTLMSGVIARDQVKALISFYGYGDIAGAWYSKPDPYYCCQPTVTKEQASSKLYLYYRQNGLWPLEVTGYDPETSVEKINPYSPIKNITKDYPPTLLIHGDIDTDVPYAQSLLMAIEFLKTGATYELDILSGIGHAFDLSKDAMDKPEIAAAFRHALEFLKKYV